MVKVAQTAGRLALVVLGVGACSEAGEMPPGYVGGETCVTCHAEQADRWAGSHHDLAMQVAGEGTVLGDFSPTPPVIVISGTPEEYLKQAKFMGALVTLSKPVDPDELLATVDRALAEAEV